MLVSFPENLYYYIDPIFGVKGKINNLECIIDGGIPIYKNGIGLLQNNPELKKSCEVITSGELRNSCLQINKAKITRGRVGITYPPAIFCFLV